MAAGEPRLADSTVDVHVSALSTGYGTQPLELTLTANGRPVDVRRVAAADGAPVHTVFTVSPDPTRADGLPGVGAGGPGRDRRREQHPQRAGRAARAAPAPAAGGGRARLRAHLPEARAGARHQPRRRFGGAQGRHRRRAPDLLRAGGGVAGRRRWPAASPRCRADLFQYDAVVFGNVEAAFFTPRPARGHARRSSPPAAAGCWCSAAARSSSRGWPARRSTRCCRWTCRIAAALVARVSSGGRSRRHRRWRSPPTAPIIRPRAAAPPPTRRGARWQALPSLASVSIVGGPRPGAQVLAVAGGAAGETRPLLAVQRYGQGRAMVFAGEASWRWRMMLPAADTRYDTIWRQMARWLARGVDRAGGDHLGRGVVARGDRRASRCWCATGLRSGARRRGAG